jgi:hypothetical protein
MSIDQLPPGTDVLKARNIELAHNGQLTRREEAAVQTAAALVARLLATRSRLSALDGGRVPDPVALVAVAAELGRRPSPSFNLQHHLPWRFLEAIAPEVLTVEARLDALEGIARVESPDPPEVLERMVLEMGLDGSIHRHQERWWETLESLVPRVLSIEARTVALEAARTPAPRKGVK